MTIDNFIEVLCHIAIDDEEAGAKEFLERRLEIVEQQILQSALSSLLILVAHEACDGRSIRIDELAQHMDAQITCSTCEEHIAQLLALALDEGLYPILLQDGIDA